jgi:acetoin utilization deacetylase AcuC-like enzyme
MDPVLLISDPRMVAHDPGAGHPERPDRLRAVRNMLEARPILGTAWEASQPAAREIVARVHPPAHIARVESLRGQHGAIDPDTHASPGTVEAAWLAAGSAVRAVDAVMTGDTKRAFALVRPPGHHAEPATAMGFCFFNNIAIAASHAVAAHGCERVLVVDWDVHHGNGTQRAFFGRRDVLFWSSHRYPFYPGTGAAEELGAGAGEGYTLNLPLPGGTTDGDYVAFYRDLLVPVAEAYRPDLVLVSAGFDAHRADPLGGMGVTEGGFAALCTLVKGIADRHSDGRMALVLEGGYDLAGLSRSVHACTEVLTGLHAPVEASPTDRGHKLLGLAGDVYRRYWKV